jgi:hypothetical protein
LVRRALRTEARPLIGRAAAAAASQIAAQRAPTGSRAATTAVTVATTPLAAMPQPETAVAAVARAMVSRMNSRLSIARRCSAGVSRGPAVGARSVAMAGRQHSMTRLSSALRYEARSRSHPLRPPG